MTTAADLVSKAKSKIRELTPQDVFKKLGKVMILDVREAEEYAAGHIPGAINIPRGLLEFRIDQHPALYDRNNEIVVNCQGGGHSALAIVSLQDLGYKHAGNLAGGYSAWAAAGLPTEKP